MLEQRHKERFITICMGRVKFFLLTQIEIKRGGKAFTANELGPNSHVYEKYINNFKKTF